MNANQQHMLDAYRAAQRGEVAPVLPGSGTARTAHEIRLWRRFHSVVTDPADRLPARVGRALRGVGAALGLSPRLPLPPPTPPATHQGPTNHQGSSPHPGSSARQDLSPHPGSSPRQDPSPHQRHPSTHQA